MQRKEKKRKLSYNYFGVCMYICMYVCMYVAAHVIESF